MMQLFIEGQQVDVDEGFSTLISYAIDDIKDFGSREAAFSKTIILPGTKRNNIAFGNIFDFNSGVTFNPASKNVEYNFNPAIGADVLALDGGVQVLKGVARLLQINIDGGFVDYEVAIFGDLGGFAAKMGNNKLTDLDFSAYNHTYSIANITASWNNYNAGSGYYYPLIDYGNYGRNAALSAAGKHSWKYMTFRPALFAKEYIEKIFAAAGYTYDCPLFSTSRFEGLIVPHNQKALYRNSGTLLNVSQNTMQTEVGDAAGYVSFQVLNVLGAFTVGSSGTWTNNQYTNGGGSVTTTITFTCLILQSFVNNPAENWTMDISVGGGTGSGTSDVIPYDSINQQFTATWTGTIPPGAIVSVLITAPLSNNPLDYLTFQDGLLNMGSPTSLQQVPVNIGEDVYMNSTIPQNILQKDFIADILKLFNLYLTEDRQKEKHLVIKPFPDFYQTIADAEDWSLKVDRSKVMKVKPMSELNSRYYEFRFKDDSDYWNDLYKKRYNEGYGSRIYDSEFEFTNETTKVELKISPTPLVGYTGEDKVYSTIFKWNGGIVGAGEENIDSNIRLLQAKKVTGVTSWDILADDGTTVLGSYTDYPYAGHLDDPDAPTNDLNFGSPKELFFVLLTGALNINQFNVYWSTYMAEITNKDAKLLTCTLRLNKMDIYNLAFDKYKWIDGSLWRLNKIVDYNASVEDVCTAEFIKVIETVY